MDEQSQAEPETQTNPTSSTENDTGSAETESAIKTLDDTLRADNAAPDTVSHTLQTIGSPEKDPQLADHESARSDLGIDHEALPIDTSDSTDFETPGEDKESGTEDAKLDRAGAGTESRETEKSVESDFSASVEVKNIQGSSEEKAAAEETDKQQEDTGDAAVDDKEKSSGEADAAGAGEQTSEPAERETTVKPAKNRSMLKMTASAVVIVAAFAGFFIFDSKSKIRASSKEKLKAPESREISLSRQNKTRTLKPPTPPISTIYDAKLQEITALRDTLLGKQEEVRRLKAQYRDGIEELEKEIIDELQKKEISTLWQAMENKSIDFALRTIQRRRAYIKELDGPSEWIFSACEELLYIKRHTVMDIQVAEIAGGIDMNQHMQQINAAVQKYQPTADRLALDTTGTEVEPLEVIWKGILEQNQQYSSVQAHSRNQIISEQICTGNFDRLSEISEISPETAKCINEMPGSDLFLNGLSEISPGAARQLFHWKGSWICLNGIRALSPRVAHYLFQWDGNWVSLNGLTEFPAEIGETLLQWGGHQLELMGLQFFEDFPERIAVEYLAQWERAGGKLFVTKSVRKKIDELNREPT